MTSRQSDNRAIIFLAVCLSTATITNAFATNRTCTAPYASEVLGHCGPAFCDKIKSTLPPCDFTETPFDYPEMILKVGSKKCKQNRDDRCTSKTLGKVMKGKGVKAAYCNDKFLVIHTDTSSGLQDYLDTIPIPPTSLLLSDGTKCATRTLSAAFATIKIPLFPTMLDTSDPEINNIDSDAFAVGGSSRRYDTETGSYATMGLPIEGIFIIKITCPSFLVFFSHDIMWYDVNMQR